MSRGLMYALVLPLLAAEVWAQFVARDQRWTTVFAVLALGVLAVRYLLGPQTGAEGCPPDCAKCRESWEADL
ncbi:hypothetical protein JIX56_24100 [Streptomyces sp. CA-210063]|uniref:hypothetical protein n=1 Tax=Streptomyces sp. CA-210063 TaxID=2801029 RepID=UPI00214CDC73|nr:hypothetical protein [Streptomyces sp. CA-210063]UUU32728.1 hypothetical protein JIX56_24100 [Streptomyces sp. CA-210063]